MVGRRPRSLQLLRYGVHSLVGLYVLVLVVAGTAGQRWAANLHTICPFGGVVNLYTYFANGGYVAKLHSAVFIMLLALLIGLVLTGKSFCGWICPLGSMQQALGWVGRRLWPGAYNRMPHRLERISILVTFDPSALLPLCVPSGRLQRHLQLVLFRRHQA